MIIRLLQVVKGEKDFSSNNADARPEVWEFVKRMISNADDPVGITWSDARASARVDEILREVANGTLTPDEGKRLMVLVSMGFEITELPDLLAKVEQLAINVRRIIASRSQATHWRRLITVVRSGDRVERGVSGVIVRMANV